MAYKKKDNPNGLSLPAVLLDLLECMSEINKVLYLL